MTNDKDWRETLQERLAEKLRTAHYGNETTLPNMKPWAAIPEHRKDCWRKLAAVAIREATDVLDEAEAEIARLEILLEDVLDDARRLHKEKCDLLYPDTAASLPVGDGVVERKDFVALIERIDFERGINECCGHSVGGNSPDEPPSCCAQPERFIPLADVLKAASLLHQPEASDFDRDFSALSARALQRGFILRLEPGNE